MPPINVPFVILVLVTITAAVQVVTHRNIVHATLYLGLTFVGVAGMYFLLNSPFLAAAQVLIYVGAVTVLILFALMLTGQRIMREPRNALPYRVVSAVVALVLFAMLAWVARSPVWARPEPQAEASNVNLDQLATALLGTYLLPFEIASVLLLVALIGAIVLAKEEREA